MKFTLEKLDNEEIRLTHVESAHAPNTFQASDIERKNEAFGFTLRFSVLLPMTEDRRTMTWVIARTRFLYCLTSSEHDFSLIPVDEIYGILFSNAVDTMKKKMREKVEAELGPAFSTLLVFPSTEEISKTMIFDRY